ncbi:hypothetical protein M2302_002237 [Micromonospora sp. A200]|uniref:hypothetical protein n=1 Tax=Micromonospora sp. A200 TaxID=2940568 RepID=UPI00247562A7|nr:hypothetical protein [Micromonospora sp. A200]MDH6462062.1 hypothetical protein [Micromonospora sp. A200]
MATQQHQVVKPEKLALTAVGMLEQELVIPALFQKEGIDQFRGAKDDTVSVTVEGVLPFHEYGWRNDRTNPLQFDTYSERKIAVTFGGDVYNAVKLTDEQAEMDLDGWGKLLRPQVKAIARGMQRRAVKTLTDQTYAVTVGNAEQNLRGALIEARRVLNKFNVPDGARYLLVGSDFETALLGDEKLNLAQNVGEAEAASALRNATIGDRYGFKIVVDQTIPGDAAFAFASSAFIFLNAAPAVPQSVPFGSTTSFEGISLRWMRDYDSMYLQDRSIVNTYVGFRSVTDVLVGWDAVQEKEVVSTGEHFVRGIKLTLDGASNYPAAASELATITGISDAAVWTPAGMKPETDPANA